MATLHASVLLSSGHSQNLAAWEHRAQTSPAPSQRKHRNPCRLVPDPLQLWHSAFGGFIKKGHPLAIHPRDAPLLHPRAIQAPRISYATPRQKTDAVLSRVVASRLQRRRSPIYGNANHALISWQQSLAPASSLVRYQTHPHASKSGPLIGPQPWHRTLPLRSIP